MFIVFYIHRHFSNSSCLCPHQFHRKFGVQMKKIVIFIVVLCYIIVPVAGVGSGPKQVVDSNITYFNLVDRRYFSRTIIINTMYHVEYHALQWLATIPYTWRNYTQYVLYIGYDIWRYNIWEGTGISSEELRETCGIFERFFRESKILSKVIAGKMRISSGKDPGKMRGFK